MNTITKEYQPIYTMIDGIEHKFIFHPTERGLGKFSIEPRLSAFEHLSLCSFFDESDLAYCAIEEILSGFGIELLPEPMPKAV